MKSKRLVIFFFLLLISPEVFAVNETILNNYLKLQKEFYTELCASGTVENFQSLDKKYRGDGNFIPVLLDEKVDLKTIKNLLPLMKEKSLWIQSQLELLKKTEDFRPLLLELDLIEKDIALLQEAKKEYFFSREQQQKESIKKNAAIQFEQVLAKVEQFKEQVPFLLSFKFPINHLSLRAEYEKYKHLLNKEARSRSNSVYFFRKIVQDGSYDTDFSKNDAVIRSGFDTLYQSLTKDKKRDFLTDNERVDFKFVLRNFAILLSHKPDVLIERFEEWKARNERSIAFYQDLLDGKKIKISENSQIKDITTLLEDRARSLYTLKDFALTKEARAYEFWSGKSDLFQSLYTIETILYSEVGRADSSDALERRDVAQVVINRSKNSTYNFLSEKDSISKYLSPKLVVEDSKWLNVLFKEGEFSFTYFYIPGNLHIYCPDMSKIGQKLRRENVKIALELLKKPRADFKALRYFSRISMFGRIEMDSLWDTFIPVPEAPGKLVKSKKVFKMFKKYSYKYLYDFTNEQLKKNFLVVDLKGKTYVVDSSNTKQIYYYRNPHQFKYFSLLK